MASVVFDRPADCIRHGAHQIGRASQATGLRVNGESWSALEVFLRDAGGASTAWVVPGINEEHAPTMGRAIAEYLGVPLVSRVA